MTMHFLMLVTYKLWVALLTSGVVVLHSSQIQGRQPKHQDEGHKGRQPYGFLMCSRLCQFTVGCVNFKYISTNLLCDVTDKKLTNDEMHVFQLMATEKLQAQTTSNFKLLPHEEDKLGKNGFNCTQKRENVFYYNGTVDFTWSGKKCQRWDQQFPHKHSKNTPDKFITGERIQDMHNYCRNVIEPDGSMITLPWCYTTSLFKRWDICKIQPCQPYNGGNFVLRRSDLMYRGKKNTTLLGLTCQRWDSEHTHKHDLDHQFVTGERNLSEVANYCRATQWMQFPFCYTTNPNVRFDFCAFVC